MGVYYTEGRYKAEILEQGFTDAKTGTTQFVLAIRIFETENGDPVNEGERFVFRPLTEKTMPYLLEDLRALGYEGNSLQPLADGNQFIGKTAVFFVKHEQDREGRMQERWSVYRGGGGASMESLTKADPAKLRNLDVLFGRAAKQAKPMAKSAPPPADWVPSDADVPM